MAFGTTTIFEIRDGGVATNGGAYDPSIAGAGTDYSQQDAAQLALTDVVANGTTTITSVTGGFTSAMIGNVIYIAGGTAPALTQRRMITGVTDTNTATVGVAIPTGTGITGNVGGALNDIDDTMVGGSANFTASNSGTTMTVSAITEGEVKLGMLVTGGTFAASTYVSSFGTGTGGTGTYTVTISQTVASTGAIGSGSCVYPGNVIFDKTTTNTITSVKTFVHIGTNSNSIRWIGYSSTRTVYSKDASKPLYTTATNSTTLFNIATIRVTLRNIDFTNTAAVRSVGLNTVLIGMANSPMKYLSFSGFTTGAAGTAGLSSHLFTCNFDNCTTAGVSNSIGGGIVLTAKACTFRQNAIGINLATGAAVIVEDSLFAYNTNIGVQVTTLTGPTRITRNLFYNNTNDAIKYNSASAATSGLTITDNIFYGGVNGINSLATTATELGRMMVANNAFGGQSGAARVNFDTGEDEVTLTADPCIDGANYNFGLNRVAGGGMLLRATGYPNTWKNTSTTGYLDIGPVQNHDIQRASGSVG